MLGPSYPCDRKGFFFPYPNMKTWLISDTHFFHKNIGVYCGRPDGWQERILENLKCVGPEDILFHLGDVAFRYDRQAVAELVAALPGAKRSLIEGNHDRSSRVRREPVWSEVTRYHKIYRFLAVYGYPVTGVITIDMTHNPEDFGDSSPNIFLHGHVHELGKPWRWDEKGRLWVNLCVEQWSYKPVELETILTIYREKQPCP